MKTTQKDCILMTLLDCGIADLEMLDDIKYDLTGMVNELVENNNLSFNNLLSSVFQQAQQDLRSSIDEHIAQSEEELTWEVPEDEAALLEEQKELRSLTPEDDMTWYTNYLDSHIYINTDKRELYDKYLDEEIEAVEEIMGFSFS